MLGACTKIARALSPKYPFKLLPPTTSRSKITVLPSLQKLISMTFIARLTLVTTLALTSLCVAAQDKKPDLAKGEASFAVCAACHGSQGEGNAALNAPKLAGQPAWYLKRQVMSYKTGLRGVGPGDTYGQQMVGMVATLPDEASVDNVVAHIQTLPDNATVTTIDGDIARGQKLYTVCAYCHGGDGMGRQALNAPRLSGSSDWYLARQLRHFKEGVRGAHPKDYYGYQMGLLSQTLQDEQAVDDIVAYINTL